MKWFGSRREKLKPSANAYPTLQTKRLTLRMFEPADAAALYAYSQNPHVGPPAGWAPHRSLEESRQIVRRFIIHGDVWAIVERNTGHLIGTIGLHADGKREVENARNLGYALDEAYWNRGYATEAAREVLRFAFFDLKCPVVSVCRFPDNAQSARVIEKLGFVHEGTLRLSFTGPSGTLMDEVCYSLTREEYLMLPKNQTDRERGRADAAAQSL